MLATPEADIQMSPEEFAMIRDYIHEQSGIFFGENKMYLVKNRLAKRMADLEIKSVRDYFYHVKYDSSLKEFNKLMDLITTNETSFFRNEPQLLSFSREVLPLMIKEKQENRESKTIRLWSAGCSTGEEPYTLAMILLEKVVPATGWKLEIIASDISEAVLHRARTGEYSGITLRNIKPEFLVRYFTRDGDRYQVKPELKALIKFSQLNLNDERKVSTLGNLDAVFCRNVMIYFSDEVKKRVVRGFYNDMRPGGYFYIGHSETLHGISKAFKLVYFKNALVYQKEKVRMTAAPAACTGAERRSTVPLRPPADAAPGTRRALDLLSRIKPMTVKK
jgi:chemotaxis protein methyltransferase CheR